MNIAVWANVLGWLFEEQGSRVVLHAMPLLLVVLLVLAIAYRYYSAFLAARVAMLDDSRQTPAHTFYDGQNYHPTNRWVLFGHHFAAISGAGPLIGPVLAIQYGYMPGLLWLLVGVCLAGAVQDMLVLAASVRHQGKSLAEIARAELGPWATLVVSAAILFIVIIALAGLGIVVVKALGGEEVKLPKGMEIKLEKGSALKVAEQSASGIVYRIPENNEIKYPGDKDWSLRPESFLVRVAELQLPEGTQLRLPKDASLKAAKEEPDPEPGDDGLPDLPQTTPIEKHLIYTLPAETEVRKTPGDPWKKWSTFLLRVPASQPLSVKDGLVTLPVGVWQIHEPLAPGADNVVTLPDRSWQKVPGSSWGTFTIACTIPIALFVGLYMYKIRKGHIVEASLLGAAATIAATIIGNWIPGSPLEPYFSLSREHTILAIMGYGFIASVLPVWLLLCPRDYLSSYLKIGTIALLVIGILLANPAMRAPVLNEQFLSGGPTFKGSIFPFVFICIMCGAVSGFHALVASGTTPKMINRESDIRPIGYGAMLMEGLVGVVALIAAASLPVPHYFQINTDLSEVQKYETQVKDLYKQLGEMPEARDPLHGAGVRDAHQLPVNANLADLERMVGGESLRGRTGGAVTLAVGMALIFTTALSWTGLAVEGVMKYWYHFAIMFEALFILTTIDTGTRIARFLLQEAGGKIYPRFGQTDWLPSAVLSTFLVTVGWGALVWTGSISTIWPMFGIANQLLAVVALCLVTTWLVNTGRGRYAWVTVPPMLFVLSTTTTAATQLVTYDFPAMIADSDRRLSGLLNMGFTIFVLACVFTLILLSLARWTSVALRKRA